MPLLIALLAALGTLEVVLADGPTVISGQIPHDKDAAGIRYKSFNNGGDREIFLGVDVDNHKIERNITWVSGDNDVSFVYDNDADLLTTTIRDTIVVTYPNFSTEVATFHTDGSAPPFWII